MEKRNQKRPKKTFDVLPDLLLRTSVALIIVLLPFHAFFTAWAASNFGNFDLIRLWKEALLLWLTLGCGVYLLNSADLRSYLRRSLLMQVIFFYLLLTGLMAITGVLAGFVGFEAAVYGAVIDSRPLLFFLVVFILYKKNGQLFRAWPKWLIYPGLIVILFGMLQLILPDDFLRHFGYGPDTLQAYQPVDNKSDLARVQSTLRGPNPLGAYLVPILMLFLAGWSSQKKRHIFSIALVLGLIVVLATYSRSALLGLALATLAYGYMSIKNSAKQRRFLSLSLLLVIITSCIVVVLRNNDFIQNYVFHTNEQSQSAQSSNEQRLSAIKEGVEDIAQNPFGSGVGSAGPASLRNDASPARINESYFLQIGSEMGLIGLGLFIAVIAGLTRRLWSLRQNPLARATLAAMIGLIFINLVSHAWADDTLAYLFFGMVGFVLAENRTKSENQAIL
jgi:hypothetical protein